MIAKFENLKTLEAEVRKLKADSSWAVADGKIGENVVTVKVDRAMINRGMATGTSDRWTYRLEGKRISRANLLDIVPFS